MEKQPEQGQKVEQYQSDKSLLILTQSTSFGAIILSKGWTVSPPGFHQGEMGQLKVPILLRQWLSNTVLEFALENRGTICIRSVRVCVCQVCI